MIISEKSKQHIDSCRFCWMCRHICPISIATGQERNTSRARALSLSLVVRGAESIEEVVDNLYECALCGACVKECVTGWDPVMFTREARTSALLEGAIPSYVKRLLDNIDTKFNVYGKDDPMYFKERKGSDTLLFLGEDARYMSEDSCTGAIALLDKAGADFDVRNDEANSGNSLYFLTGKSAESMSMMQNCANFLNAYKTVIVYDPADLKLFLREYKEFGISLTAKIIGFNEYVLSLIESGKINVTKSSKKYTIQDNFNYSRELSDSETARNIIDRIGENKDFLMSGRDTMFAGSLLMHEYMPEQMKRVARDRWKNAVGVCADIVVTENPSEYEMLKKTVPESLTVITLERAVLDNIK